VKKEKCIDCGKAGILKMNVCPKCSEKIRIYVEKMRAKAKARKKQI